MRILLIHPPDNKVSLSPGRFEPLSLEVLAATLPGHEITILDLRIDGTKALERHIGHFKPQVAGVTVNNAIHVKQARKVLEQIRSLDPGITLIVGGHHPTMMPQDFHLPCVDVIFHGWAEKSFPAFIHAVASGKPLAGIPGIEVLDKGERIFQSDPDWELKPSEIPIPRRDLISRYQKKYRSDMGFRTALINTTRGCPGRCSFCGVWQVTGGRFLIREPEEVFKEIAAVPEFIKRIFFADDNTFINPKYAGELCRLIRESGIKKKYSGYCRSDTIIRHPELMQEWKDIGLDNLCVGFEGIDNDRLTLLNKRNTTTNNEAAAKILNDIGIPFRPHFLIEPAFLKDDFRALSDYVDALGLRSPIFPILTPIPGTQYYFEVKDKILLDYDFFDFAHATLPTNLSSRDFYRAWIKLYLKSYPVRKNLKHFFLRNIARISGRGDLVKKHHHLRLINLLMLRVFGIALYIKLYQHYRYLKRMKIDSPAN